jgi:hypothetical protein
MAKSYSLNMLVDALPDHLQKAVAADRQANGGQQRGGLELIASKGQKWRPGDILKVGFRGGTEDLYGKIAFAASAWIQCGNIQLEFNDPQTGSYHTWSPQDTQFDIHIRIGFDQAGYWSLVGTDSTNPAISQPGSSSMNFDGFDQSLPDDWAATVVHEFGHSFGFEHEHQHPSGVCEDEFRWDDDSGYVLTTDANGEAVPDSSGRQPGIYTVLGAPPNRWDKSKIDSNLRELKESSAFQLTAFDKNSIMKYYFGAWMFHQGEQSRCFSQRNLTLSDVDKQGFADAYPG